MENRIRKEESYGFGSKFRGKNYGTEKVLQHCSFKMLEGERYGLLGVFFQMR